MNISHHIKILLSEYDCVIIPDFGAFVAEYRAPLVDAENASIPSKDILFNRQLTRNDGLLINAIIEADGISYEDAKKSIAAEVSEIRAHLDSGHDFVFEDIGTMSLDDAGFIQFIADTNNTCLLDAYGLQPIHLEKIDKDEPQESTITPKETPAKHRRLTIQLSAAAALIILLIIFAPPLSDKAIVDKAGLDFDNNPAVPTLNQEQGSLPKADEGAPSLPLSRANKEADNKTEAETDSSIAQASDEQSKSAKVTTNKQYHIIIASLPNERLAQEYVSDFNKKYDFDTIETLTGSGRYRISVAHFSQKKEAVAFVKSLRLLNPKFKDAWLLGVSPGQ